MKLKRSNAGRFSVKTSWFKLLFRRNQVRHHGVQICTYCTYGTMVCDLYPTDDGSNRLLGSKSAVPQQKLTVLTMIL